MDQLQGSQAAKERFKVVLETLAGSCRVFEACARLHVCAQRFHQLRQYGMQLALSGFEPGPRGRPPHRPSPAEEKIAALQEQVAALQIELRMARAREEIALVLPNTRRADGNDADDASDDASEKKTRGRLRKNPFRPPGMRKNT